MLFHHIPFLQGTNLIPSDNLITLAEAVVDLSLKQSLSLIYIKYVLTEFSTTRGCGSAITVILTLAQRKLEIQLIEMPARGSGLSGQYD